MIQSRKAGLRFSIRKIASLLPPAARLPLQYSLQRRRRRRGRRRRRRSRGEGGGGDWGGRAGRWTLFCSTLRNHRGGTLRLLPPPTRIYNIARQAKYFQFNLRHNLWPESLQGGIVGWIILWFYFSSGPIFPTLPQPLTPLGEFSP